MSYVNVPGASRTARLLAAASLLLLACHSNADPASGPPENAEASPGSASADAPTPVQPPFSVQGELDGLLMVWFDGEGVHTAQKRSEIPEARREQVRIDSLNVAPDARLDADHLYIADVRTTGKDGSYPVQKATRSWFDAQVDRAKPQVAANTAGIVMYKASWCGACRSAAAYMRARHVDFVEKDVEKDPGASDEMLRKAREKGLTPRGVPVIDFRGEIMLGFDQARVQALIDRSPKAI
jgi:glutaredoxin